MSRPSSHRTAYRFVRRPDLFSVMKPSTRLVWRCFESDHEGTAFPETRIAQTDLADRTDRARSTIQGVLSFLERNNLLIELETRPGRATRYRINWDFSKKPTPRVSSPLRTIRPDINTPDETSPHYIIKRFAERLDALGVDRSLAGDVLGRGLWETGVFERLCEDPDLRDHLFGHLEKVAARYDHRTAPGIEYADEPRYHFCHLHQALVNELTRQADALSTRRYIQQQQQHRAKAVSLQTWLDDNNLDRTDIVEAIRGDSSDACNLTDACDTFRVQGVATQLAQKVIQDVKQNSDKRNNVKHNSLALDSLALERLTRITVKLDEQPGGTPGGVPPLETFSIGDDVPHATREASNGLIPDERVRLMRPWRETLQSELTDEWTDQGILETVASQVASYLITEQSVTRPLAEWFRRNTTDIASRYQDTVDPDAAPDDRVNHLIGVARDYYDETTHNRSVDPDELESVIYDRTDSTPPADRSNNKSSSTENDQHPTTGKNEAAEGTDEPDDPAEPATTKRTHRANAVGQQLRQLIQMSIDRGEYETLDDVPDYQEPYLEDTHIQQLNGTETAEPSRTPTR